MKISSRANAKILNICGGQRHENSLERRHRICFARIIMTLEEISTEVKNYSDAINSCYGSVVFDEWAIVSLAENKARVLFYTGPRNDEFLQNFVKDLGVLRKELKTGVHGVGDFEFSRNGVGTGYDAFLVLTADVYLVCNNTRESMANITKNPRWLEAQVPFVEFAEKVQGNPLEVAWGTKIFNKS
jgi:hypothetical protein